MSFRPEGEILVPTIGRDLNPRSLAALEMTRKKIAGRYFMTHGEAITWH
jgi:hypothetical protein